MNWIASLSPLPAAAAVGGCWGERQEEPCWGGASAAGRGSSGRHRGAGSAGGGKPHCNRRPRKARWALSGSGARLRGLAASGTSPWPCTAWAGLPYT